MCAIDDTPSPSPSPNWNHATVVKVEITGTSGRLSASSSGCPGNVGGYCGVYATADSTCRSYCAGMSSCGAWTRKDSYCTFYTASGWSYAYHHLATTGVITNRGATLPPPCNNYVCYRSGSGSYCSSGYPAASVVGYKQQAGPTVSSTTSSASTIPVVLTMRANANEASSAQWNTPAPLVGEFASAGPVYIGFGGLTVNCPCYSGVSGIASLLATSVPPSISGNTATTTWSLPTYATQVQLQLTVTDHANVAVPVSAAYMCAGTNCPGASTPTGTEPWRDFATSMQTQTGYNLPMWVSVPRAAASAGLKLTVQITTPNGVISWCTSAGHGYPGGEATAYDSQFSLQMVTTSLQCRWPYTRDGTTCRLAVGFELNSTSLFDRRNTPYKETYCVTGNYSSVTPVATVTESAFSSSICPTPQICYNVAANSSYKFTFAEPATAACYCTPRTDRCALEGECMYDGQAKGTIGVAACLQCKPAVTTDAFTFVPNTPCDDQDLCTRVDTCTNGTCAGTPFRCLRLEHTGSERQNCEECDGDGCQKRTDYAGCVKTLPDGSKSCGCSIGGVCFADGEANPENSCLWCDVLKDVNGWSPAPARRCDDGIACTFDDTCSGGVCVGTDYSCEATGLCMADNTCDGLGGCTPVWKPATTVCRNGSIAECDFPWYCTGANSYCQPQVASNVPQLSAGTFVRAVSPSSASSQPQSVSETMPTDLWPVADAFGLLPLNFSVTCGSLDYKLSLLVDDATFRVCDTDLLQRTDVTLLTLNGASAHIAAPAAQRRPQSFADAAADGGYIGLDDGGVALAQYEGKLLRPVVQLTLFDGSTALYCPSPFYVATRPPSAGTIVHRDPSTGAELVLTPSGYVHNGYALAFSWSGFVAASSAASFGGGALAFSYKIGTTPGGQELTGGWVGAGVGTGSVVTDMQALHVPEGTYYVTLRAAQRDGRTAESMSDAILVDRTPPAFGSVFDGAAPPTAAGAPLRASQYYCLGASKTLRVRFPPAVPARSAISHYEVGFGERPGAVTIGGVALVPHTNQTEEFTFSRDAPDLLPGVVVYATVRAVSVAGTSQTRITTGQMHDPAPVPTIQLLVAEYASLVTGRDLPLPWLITENYCPLSGADVWIGSTSGAADVLPAQRLLGASQSLVSFRTGSAARLPAALVELSANDSATRTLHVCVRAYTCSECASEASCVATTLDFTPPQAFEVTHSDAAASPTSSAWLQPVRYSAATGVFTRWTAAQDPESGVVDYSVRITSCRRQSGDSINEACDFEQGPFETVLPWRSVGMSSLHFMTTPAQAALFPAGRLYATTVRATNAAGGYTDVTSAGVVLDTTPPAAQPTSRIYVINEGAAGVEARAVTNVQNMTLGIVPFVDAESGVVEVCVDVRLVTSARGVSPVTSTSLGSPTCVEVDDSRSAALRVLHVSLLGLGLQPGQRYNVAARFTNRVGLESAALMLTDVIVDSTPPVVLEMVVNDGGSAVDTEYAACGTQLPAVWFTPAMDGECEPSDLVYTVSVGTSPGAADVLAGVPSSPRNTAALPRSVNMSAYHGQWLYSSVRVTNLAGLASVKSSNGFLVDCTAPRTGLVLIGTATDPLPAALAIVSSSGVPVTLIDWLDEESPITRVEYTVKRVDTGAVLGVRSLAQLTSAVRGTQLPSDALVRVTLSSTPPDGSRITVTAVLTNAAGLTATATSAAVLVDASAPVCTSVTFLPTAALEEIGGSVTSVAGGNSVYTITVAPDADVVLSNASALLVPLQLRAHDPHSRVSVTYVLGHASGSNSLSGAAVVAPPELRAQLWATSGSGARLQLPAQALSAASQSAPLRLTARVTNEAGLSCSVTSPAFVVNLRLPSAVWLAAQQSAAAADAASPTRDKLPLVYNGGRHADAGAAANLSLVAGTQLGNTIQLQARVWLPPWWLQFFNPTALQSAASWSSADDAVAFGWALYICLGAAPGSCATQAARRAVVNGTTLAAALAAAGSVDALLTNGSATWLDVTLHASQLTAGRHFLTVGLVRVTSGAGVAATLSNLNGMLVTASPLVPFAVELNTPLPPEPIVGVAVTSGSVDVRCVSPSLLSALPVTWNLPTDSFIMMLDLSLRVVDPATNASMTLLEPASVGRRLQAVVNVTRLHAEAVSAGGSLAPLTSAHVLEVSLTGTTVAGSTTLPRTTSFRMCAAQPPVPDTVLVVRAGTLPVTSASAWTTEALQSLTGSLGGGVVDGTTQTVHIAWNATASASADGVAIAGYAVGFGLQPGDVSLTGMLPVQMLAVPAGATFTSGLVTLTTPVSHGLRMYGTLQVRDVAGNTVMVPFTQSVDVQATPPRLPAAQVRLGTSATHAQAQLGSAAASSARSLAQSSTSTLCFAWSGFSSQVTSLSAIARDASSVLGASLIDLPTLDAGTHCLTGLSMVQGKTYWVTLTAALRGYPATMQVPVTSTLGMLVDALPPTRSVTAFVPPVTSAPSFEASWQPVVTASGIHFYEVALTTCAHACDTVPSTGAVVAGSLTTAFMNVGARTRARFDNLASPAPACAANASASLGAYRIVLRVTSNANLSSTMCVPSTTRIDTSRPAGGEVRVVPCAATLSAAALSDLVAGVLDTHPHIVAMGGDATPQPAVATQLSSAGFMCLQWAGVTVPPSGVTSVRIALGSYACATDVMAPRTLSSSSLAFASAPVSNVSGVRVYNATALLWLPALHHFPAAQPLWAAAVFTSGVGLEYSLCAATSQQLVHDAVRPARNATFSNAQATTSSVSRLPLLLPQGNSSQVTCTWAAADCAGAPATSACGSGVSYVVAVGTPNDWTAFTRSWVAVGAALQYTLPASALNLTSSAAGDALVVCSVRVVSGAGTVSVASTSAPLVLDRSPPAIGNALVVHGTFPAAAVRATISTSHLDVYVAGFEESILGSELVYEVAAGTSPGSTNVAPWRSAGFGPVLSLDGLSLQDGARVWVMVRARNVAGLTSASVSTTDAITVDSAPAHVTDAYRMLQEQGVQQAIVAAAQGASIGSLLTGVWPADAPPPVASLGTPFGSGVASADRLTCTAPALHKVMATAASGAGGDDSLSATAYACAPGYEFEDLFGACMPCATGSFKPTAGDGACVPCTDERMATNVTNHGTACVCEDASRVFDAAQGACVCAPGFTDLASGDCVPCGDAMYKPASGVGACRDCPAGTRGVPAIGSTACEAVDASRVYLAASDSITCARGFTAGDSDTGCVACPAGLAKPDVGEQACAQCPLYTLPSADGSTCLVDAASAPLGAVFVSTPAWQLACPAGTAYAPPEACGDARGACLPCSFHSYRDAPQLLPRVNVQGNVSAPSLMSATLAGVAYTPHELRAGSGFVGSVVCTLCPDTLASAFISSVPTLYADWSGVFAGVGASNTFEVAVGTSMGGAQVIPFAEVGTTTAAVITLPAIVVQQLSNISTVATDGSPVTPLGVPLYITITSRDAYGRTTAYASAQPVLLDATPAIMRSVIDGTPDALEPGAQLARKVGAPPTDATWREDADFAYLTGVRDADFTRVNTAFNISFEAPLDPDTGIAALAVCLGSAPGACDVHERVPAPRQPGLTLVEFTGLNVSDGARVYGTLFAMNGAQALRTASTNGLEVVVSPGTPGRVFDTPAAGLDAATPIPVDADCLPVGAPLRAAWSGFTSRIPLVNFSIGWGSSPGAFDVQPLTPVGLVSSYTNRTVFTQPGMTVYATVVAYAVDGVSMTATSDGVTYVCPANLQDAPTLLAPYLSTLSTDMADSVLALMEELCVGVGNLGSSSAVSGVVDVLHPEEEGATGIVCMF